MAETAGPRYGKYRAYVVDHDDPDHLGRIRVHCPRFPDVEPAWCLPSVPFAGPGRGLYAIPGQGARVWLEFEGGDRDLPIWSGGFWGPGELPTADAKTAPHQTVWRTDGVSLTCEDGGFTLVLGDDETRVDVGPAGIVVEHQGTRITVGEHGLRVDVGEAKLAVGPIEIATQVGQVRTTISESAVRSSVGETSTEVSSSGVRLSAAAAVHDVNPEEIRSQIGAQRVRVGPAFVDINEVPMLVDSIPGLLAAAEPSET